MTPHADAHAAEERGVSAQCSASQLDLALRRVSAEGTYNDGTYAPEAAVARFNSAF